MKSEKHGEWWWKGNGDDYDMVECSACGKIVYVYDNNIDHPYDFCPNCGADMRSQT